MGRGCEQRPSTPQPWAIHTPTFTCIILGVEIDGKVMGHLGRRDWSAGLPLRTPHHQLIQSASLKPSEESGKMAEWKDTCSSSPEKSPKLQLAAEQSSTGEHWIPPKKKISHIQGQRRSPSKSVGGEKLHLESNPIPVRGA